MHASQRFFHNGWWQLGNSHAQAAYNTKVAAVPMSLEDFRHGPPLRLWRHYSNKLNPLTTCALPSRTRNCPAHPPPRPETLGLRTPQNGVNHGGPDRIYRFALPNFLVLLLFLWNPFQEPFSDCLTADSTICRVFLTICTCSLSKRCQRGLIVWSHSSGPGPDTHSDLPSFNVYRGLLSVAPVLMFDWDSPNPQDSSDFAHMMGCSRNLLWRGVPADLSMLFQDLATKKLGAVLGVYKSFTCGSWCKAHLRIHFTLPGIPLIWSHIGSLTSGVCCWTLCSVKLSINTARIKEEKTAMARSLIPFVKMMRIRLSAILISTPRGLISSKKSAQKQKSENSSGCDVQHCSLTSSCGRANIIRRKYIVTWATTCLLTYIVLQNASAGECVCYFH